MLKSIKKNVASFGIVVGFAILFTGCAKDQLLMKTYSPPKKQKEVKQMIAQGESSGEGYLSLEIVNDISTIVKHKNSTIQKDTAHKLIASLKKYITQTNFISLSDVADTSTVSLDMKILELDYRSTANSIKGLVEVEFNIRKDYQTFYTQNYKYPINRYSKNSQTLPSKGKVLGQAADFLAKKLIKDISPIKTSKLVELKGLPDELKYTVKYAKASNFKGAIKAMEKYKGEKTAEYYFNLGVYYEALAAKTENLVLFAKADENYENAMRISEGGDEIITKGKAKFDNFYEMIKMVAQQKASNKKENSNNQFQILD
jgi:hypothetical protein